MTIVNAISRLSYKTENRIFENTLTFGVSNFDIKVILFINRRWDEGSFEKIMHILYWEEKD